MQRRQPGRSWFTRGPALLLTVATVLFLAATCGGDDDDDSHPLAILAFGVAPAPSLAGFVIDAQAGLPVLPAGEYVLYATDPDGRVLSGEAHTSNGEAAIDIPTDFEDADAEVDEAAAANITTVINFLVDAEMAKLTAFEASSADFANPLFTDGEGDPWAALEQMHAALLAVAASEDAVIAAITSLEAATAALPRVDRVAASNVPVLHPNGVFDSIKDSLFGFFGYAGDAGKRAASDVIQVGNTMTPDELAEAFADIPPALTGGATNFQELAAKLQDGSLNNSAAQIRSQLWRTVPFYSAAQNACKCDRPELSTAHKEGAELASKGADLNATVIKTVLGNVFPDITKGFDMADKANEWAEFAEKVYTDPLSAAEGVTRDALQEKIKDRIKADLAACCPDLDEDLIEKAADGVAKEALKAVPEAFGEEPTPTEDDADTPTATPTDRPDPTETPTDEATPTSDNATETPTQSDGDTPTPSPTDDDATDTPDPDETDTPEATETPTRTATSTPTPTATTASAPTPTPTATTASGAITNFAGSWVSAAQCPDNPDVPNRWTVNLSQSGAAVSGLITFHNCPGGGRVEYIVSGTATSSDSITLQGSKAGAAGPLGGSAPASQTFTVTKFGAPSPNLAG